jgi:purine-binding chemotaxis protein CheW
MTTGTAAAWVVRERLVGSTVAQLASSQAAYLIGQASNRLHAIPIEYAIEIMRALPVEPVAGGPPYVCGLCIIRGVPVPVVDPGLLLGGRQTQASRFVTLRAGQRVVALQFETVAGIEIFDAGTFNALPSLLHAAPEAVAAIGTVDNQLLLALRATRIVPDEVLRNLTRIGDRS